MPQNSRRLSSVGAAASNTGDPCSKCCKSITDLDHVLRCSRCQGQYHSKCAGLDEVAFKSYTKVSHVLCFYCPSCKSIMEGLEGRLAALESKIAAQGPQVPHPDLVTEIVTKVCDTIIPRLASMIAEQVQQVIQAGTKQHDERISDQIAEAVEAHGKRKNLVVVGLAESVNTHDFVHEVCDKLEIDRGEVVDTFRDGLPRPEGSYPRIVKVVFRNTQSRRALLTGFHGVRGEIPEGVNVWVRPDLTYRQRLRDRELRRELKERKDAGEHVKIFRGQIVPKA